jgi:hypothetical protein
MGEEVLSFKTVNRRGFPRATYRWVYTWEFALVDPIASTHEILQSMLANEHYAYSFIAPYPNPAASIGGPKVRGPYTLDRLLPRSFRQIDSGQAWEQLDGFLQRWDPPASRADLDIDVLVGGILDTADDVLSLSAGEEDRQELHWTIGDWGEFVAINRAARIVLNLAMGYD